MIKKLAAFLVCVGATWALAAQTANLAGSVLQSEPSDGRVDVTAANATAAFDPGVKLFLKAPDFIGTPTALHAVTNREFQGIPSLAVSAGGRLWATWYAGITPDEDRNNYVVLSTSGDHGATWREVLVVDPDGGGPVRAFDPELWLSPDGKLRLFWAQSVGHEGTVAGVWLLEIDNPDSPEPKYSRPVRATDGVMMCKPIVLSTGEWVLPVSTWRDTDNSAKLVVSTDQGKTWRVRGGCNVPAADRQYDEHMFVERKDGSLWLLVRTKYGIGESISTDRGVTWPELRPSAIPHTDSRFFITRLNSGNLLLVKHGPMDKRTDRSHLTAFISRDEGQTWRGGFLLDERNGVSYPDGVQAANGAIYVSYDYERRRDKEILLAIFTETDVLEGKLASPSSRLRVCINKATGLNPDVSVSSAKANDIALLNGPAAGLEYAAGETAVFEAGAKLFSNRDYPAKEVPEALRGFQFIRGNIDGVRAVCHQAGVVYVVTPSTGRNPDSRAAVLLKRGFQKTNLPEFLLFGGDANLCSVYQRQVLVDEALDFGKWSVIIFPKQ